MKRTVSLFLCAILFAACLFGCSADDPENTASLPSSHSIDPLYSNIIHTLPGAEANRLENRVISETDSFSFCREDGHCFLKFKSGNHEISLNLDEKESCGHGIFFDSMDDMYRWLLAPDISTATEEAIRHCFRWDENKGFLLPDPDCLVTLGLPDDYKLEGVSVHRDNYSLIYQTPTPLDSGRRGGIHMQTISEPEFAIYLAQYYRFQHGRQKHDTSYTVADDIKTADVYEYETQVWKHRDIQYILQSEKSTLFVEEIYVMSKDIPDNDYHLSGVTIFGCSDGLYFTLGVYYSDPEPLLELIDQLTFIKYTP